MGIDAFLVGETGEKTVDYLNVSGLGSCIEVSNTDDKTLSSFGDEPAQFDQESLRGHEHTYLFYTYFHIVPRENSSEGTTRFDIRCGSGHWLLSSHRNTSFDTMISASSDRFAIPLAKRFTKHETAVLMQVSGVENIRFSDRFPFWSTVAQKQQASQ